MPVFSEPIDLMTPFGLSTCTERVDYPSSSFWVRRRADQIVRSVALITKSDITHRPSMTEFAYGKTALGQAIYDLGFTDLSDRYLARKHRMPIARLRELRKKIRAAVKPRRASLKTGDV